ncbi:MAG: flagellar basal body-associated FliL family protein [Desulfovibrionaceae bacterium]|nr:flagellar basal body-associated FliL family protein [Desulfovibrionaceae bacterium]
MSQDSGTETQVREEVAAPEVEVAKSDNLPAPSNNEVAKVELDIEDAPFLKNEPESAKSESEKSAEDAANQEAQAKKKKKKRLIIIGAGAVLAIVMGVVAFFLLSGPSTPPPPPPVEETTKPNVVVVPSTPQVKIIPDVVRNFDLFIVPVGNSASDTKFLVCKFSTVSKSPAINSEIDHKMLVLRDAVYFYLRGKPAEYLLDSANAGEIKHDLVNILNDYLQRGKLEDVLLDNFLAY